LLFIIRGENNFDETARNNVFVEFVGNGGVFSINYERLVTERFGMRVGFGAWKSGDLVAGGNKSIITVPVLGNMLIGARSNKLEVGAGFLFGNQKFSSSFLRNNNTSGIFDLIGVIGYRYQPASNGLMFRVGATPFYALKSGNDTYPADGFLLSAGLSIGYSF
jgi:hypothetical protein